MNGHAGTFVEACPASRAWAVGGVLAGPFIALAAYAGMLAFLGPDPEELLEKRQWQDALAEADGHLPSRRWLAAISPGVFSDLLP